MEIEEKIVILQNFRYLVTLTRESKTLYTVKVYNKDDFLGRFFINVKNNCVLKYDDEQIYNIFKFLGIDNKYIYSITEIIENDI